MASLDRNYIEKQIKAAEFGKPEDQYRTGLLFATGDGVPLDLVTAHKWFNLAAMNGNLEARESRSEISMDMSRGEISVAQKMAREWYLAQ